MRLIEELGYPSLVVQAPMAGGATTAEFVSLVCEKGAMGFFGFGMDAPDKIACSLEQTKQATQKAFGANLFVLTKEQSLAVAQCPGWLKNIMDDFGIKAEPPIKSAPLFEEQLEAALGNPPKVLSFSFGIPSSETIKSVKSKGVLVGGVANYPEEAMAWQEAGADFITLQGSEAGGHQGGPGIKDAKTHLRLEELISLAAPDLKIPFWVAGGIMDKTDVERMTELKADACQLGTAFLATRECPIANIYKDSLLEFKQRKTRFTRFFSGKTARSIEIEFILSQDEDKLELPPYPQLNALTKPLRSWASQNGNPEYFSLWAGENFAKARLMSVEELVLSLS